MPKTIQPRASKTTVFETDKNLHIQKHIPENNISLILSVCDSLNNLYEKLSKLSYLMERKIMEKKLCNTGKRVMK